MTCARSGSPASYEPFETLGQMGQAMVHDGPRAADIEAVTSWSPLHNVSPSGAGGYPPALVTTSTRDDRVHPAHARLFAHALREAGQPVDYFENTAGGHAGAADNDQVARVESLIYSWLTDRLG